jgi:hypothetical protein
VPELTILSRRALAKVVGFGQKLAGNATFARDCLHCLFAYRKYFLTTFASTRKTLYSYRELQEVRPQLSLLFIRLPC